MVALRALAARAADEETVAEVEAEEEDETEARAEVVWCDASAVEMSGKSSPSKPDSMASTT